ncbi:MAG TPA: VCBS repeat-containing protein [Pyrinomonadaceae bacterium]|jgi:hypothetical protein
MKNTNRNAKYFIAAILMTLMMSGFSQTLFAKTSDSVQLTAPTNDNFADAQTINFPEYAGIIIDNSQATGEPSEPNHANASGTLHSVWFKWTAPANYSVTMQTIGSLDSTLAIYTGTALNNLTPITANDNLGRGVFKSSRVTFIANAGTHYYIAVAGAGGATGNTNLYFGINLAESSKKFDFDGNERSDFTVIRPGNRIWYINESLNDYSELIYRQFGLNGDIPLAGDYTGDGYQSDICVWRPSNGTFYILNRETIPESLVAFQWGAAGDIPVSGDFDGDDIADFAVWRPSTATFWVRRSSDGSTLAQQWGAGATDVPVVADYDGDGKTDFAVRRNSGAEEGNFYILRSSDGTYIAKNFGLKNDLIVPGDYDFDGKNDIAVYRPSENKYYVLQSGSGTILYQNWGIPGDVPVTGEYMTNPRSAFTVWRPSNGTLYILDPFDNIHAYQWGESSDAPLGVNNIH